MKINIGMAICEGGCGNSLLIRGSLWDGVKFYVSAERYERVERQKTSEGRTYNFKAHEPDWKMFEDQLNNAGWKLIGNDTWCQFCKTKHMNKYTKTVRIEYYAEITVRSELPLTDDVIDQLAIKHVENILDDVEIEWFASSEISIVNTDGYDKFVEDFTEECEYDGQ